MSSETMPSVPILPSKTKPRHELCNPCTIPTLQARRREQAAGVLYDCEALQADWCQVDSKNGDLLYVGSSTRLVNRLHPHLHIMWSVVWRRRIRQRVRVAIWAMPWEYLDGVEAWMTYTFAPLWSNAGAANRHWNLRPPDCVLPTDAFYPYRRKVLPFDTATAGVYAWMLAPENAIDDFWIVPVLQSSSRRMAVKQARNSLATTLGYMHSTKKAREAVN
jgi:hypothetical protein